MHTQPTFSFFITSYILSGHHRRADVEFEFITQLCLDSAIIGDKLNQPAPHTRLSHSQNRIWMKCSLKMPHTLLRKNSLCRTKCCTFCIIFQRNSFCLLPFFITLSARWRIETYHLLSDRVVIAIYS